MVILTKKMEGTVILTLQDFNDFSNTLEVRDQAKVLKAYDRVFDDKGRLKIYLGWNPNEVSSFDPEELNRFVRHMFEFLLFGFYKHSWKRAMEVFINATLEFFKHFVKNDDFLYEMNDEYFDKIAREVKDNKSNYAKVSYFKWFAASIAHVHREHKLIMSGFYWVDEDREIKNRDEKGVFDACKRFLKAYFNKLDRVGSCDYWETDSSSSSSSSSSSEEDEEDDSSSDDTSSSSEEEPPKKKQKN